MRLTNLNKKLGITPEQAKELAAAPNGVKTRTGKVIAPQAQDTIASATPVAAEMTQESSAMKEKVSAFMKSAKTFLNAALDSAVKFYESALQTIYAAAKNFVSLFKKAPVINKDLKGLGMTAEKVQEMANSPKTTRSGKVRG